MTTLFEKTESIELLDRVDLLLSCITKVSGAATSSSLITLIEELRLAILERDERIERVSARFDALSRAQADALVYSAEIIDELERTKQHLSDARSAAEKAANDTQRLADTVFERTNDGVLVFCGQECIACNDNVTTLLGTTREEILGSWPSAFDSAFYEDGRSAADDLKSMYANVSHNTPSVIELQLPIQGDGHFWAEVTMSAFSMSDEGHVLMVVRDVTARKQFETELRRQRDFLDNIINAVPDQLSVLSADSRLVLANNAFCKAFGVNPEEIIGQNASKLLPHELLSSFHHYDPECSLFDPVRDLVHQTTNADGSHAVLSVKQSRFGDESGDQYLVATARDITKDRAREDRLRLLASVFNGASEGVAILSRNGEICEANPAFLSMTSCDHESSIGQKIEEAIRFDAGDFRAVLKDVAGGNPWAGKAHASVNGEKDRHFWVSISPSCESHGQTPRLIALVSDITELEYVQEKLRSQAMYDNLTGLPNRRFFRDHLEELVFDYPENKSRLSVCFMDLDDFKQVNDTAGHAAGDSLLCAVGKRLRSVMGEGAFIARFGGDEFAMILAGQEYQGEQLKRKLEELLSEFRKPFYFENQEATVGLSIGVSSFPDHGQEVGTLMCTADIAMYAAKAAGKNNIRYYSPELESGINTRHQMKTRLCRALQGEDIDLHFQPKVCAKTWQPVGCEALARWITPNGNMIPPSEFVPLAEQTGLILALGERVFHKAAKYARAWANDGHAPLIAVNVSPNQLRHPNYVNQLKDILQKTRTEARWFELEITEYAMMEDVAHSIRIINELADLGFSIAVDDFGTGYSSLSYLKHFQIHTLKIDLSFIHDVTTDWQSSAVVRSIVSLGSGLGLNVVAEGVETEEQAKLLTELGCTYLQGYYFAKPMAAEHYIHWASQNAPV